MLFARKRKDLNEGMKEFESTPGAVLVDVRTPGEYAKAHIPGSINLPIHKMKSAPRLIPSKETPIFLYCVSGARADQGAGRLRRMGYRDVRSIGGLTGYRGSVEKG